VTNALGRVTTDRNSPATQGHPPNGCQTSGILEFKLLVLGEIGAAELRP